MTESNPEGTHAAQPPRATVNGREVTLPSRRPPLPGRRAAVAIAGAALLVALLVPTLAYGWVLDDVWSGLGDMVGGWISDICEDQLEQSAGCFDEIGANTVFTSAFDGILGTGSAGVATLAERVARYTIFPVACVFFSLALLMQLFKVAQRMDQTSQIPAVKEVVMLFVWVAICIYVIGHSFELVGGLYELVNGFIQSISPGSAPSLDFDVQLGDDVLSDIGFLFGLGVTALILHVIAIVVAAASNLMFLARGVQIYVYAAFAPLMLSFLAFDELRSWAVGYIKGFVAVLLSGFIMVFAIAAFPYLLAGMLSNTATVTGSTITITVTGGASSTWVIGIIAASCALLLLLIKSGTYAREIIGG